MGVGGTGQLVGLADTGVDVGSCLLAESAVAPPAAPAINASSPDPARRKVGVAGGVGVGVDPARPGKKERERGGEREEGEGRRKRAGASRAGEARRGERREQVYEKERAVRGHLACIPRKSAQSRCVGDRFQACSRCIRRCTRATPERREGTERRRRGEGEEGERERRGRGEGAPDRVTKRREGLGKVKGGGRGGREIGVDG